MKKIIMYTWVYVSVLLALCCGQGPSDENYDPVLEYKTAQWQKEVKEIKKVIAEGGSVNATDQQGRTFLHRAATSGNVEAVKLLIENGADPQLRDADGGTALINAAFGCQTSMVDMLIRNGADVNAEMRCGITALYGPASSGCLAIAYVLLDSGADVRCCTKEPEGWNPLQVAAGEGRDQIVDLLLARGAYWNVRDCRGNTVIHLASEAGFPPYYEREPGQLRIVKTFLGLGIEPSAVNNYGATALHLACAAGLVHVAEFLIDAGGDINAVDNEGMTPLHYAARKGQARVIKMLLDRGSNRMSHDSKGRTPRQLSLEEDFPDAARLLE